MAHNVLGKHGRKFCSVEPVDGAFDRERAVFERVELAEVAEYVADRLRFVVGIE